MTRKSAKSKTDQQRIIHQLLSIVSQVVGESPAVLHEPCFNGKEWDYVKECLDTTFVSSVGSFVTKFERSVADYTGARYAIATVNGSSALHLALRVCDIQAGDEVLVPSLTFVATANAVCYCGATPHFVDSDEQDLGISSTFLRDYLNKIAEVRAGICVNKYTNNPIRALVPMHVFGHPADLDGLVSVAHDFNLALIEDAAESLGSFYRDKHTGTIGLAGVLSFNGNKTITTGGGGAILTDDKFIAAKARHLSTTAKLSHRWDYIHDEVGYNYRMPNINAALGCAQLEQLDEFINAKRLLFKTYKTALSGITDLAMLEEPKHARSNYWLQAVKLQKADLSFRNAILKGLNDAGYMARPVWSLLHRFKQFEHCPRSPMPVAESLERKLINIPSSSNILSYNQRSKKLV